MKFFNMQRDVTRFRWITTASEEDGRRLTQVRFDAVAQWWVPPQVEWIPGDPNERIGDFATFHPWVHAASRRAMDVIRPFVQSEIEELPLRGLAGQYIAFHCIRWDEILHIEGKPYRPDADVRLDWYVPPLRERAVRDREFACDPRAPGRIFCSARLREAILDANLSGLIFKPVELR